MPTVASLASTLAAFSEGFVPTDFPKPPCTVGSYEESMDLGNKYCLRGLHYFNQAASFRCGHCKSVQADLAKYERLSSQHDTLVANHQALQLENARLLAESEQSSNQNELLLARLEGLGTVNQELEALVHSFQAKESAAVAEAASLSQQLSEFKELYGKKVFDLDTLCSNNQVIMSQQAKTLEAQKLSLSSFEAQLAEAVKAETAARDSLFYHQHMADQRAQDLAWLMKVGIPACVRSVLRSEAFGKRCAHLQEASVEYGRAAACAVLREKYGDAMGVDPPMFVSDGVESRIMDRFGILVNGEYELVKFVADGAIDVETLKKKLEASGVVFTG